jgi:hypothetical protein
MRGIARSARLAAWAIACGSGRVACGTTTPGEFPALVHGVIEGTVRGTAGQPFDSVGVEVNICAA